MATPPTFKQQNVFIAASPTFQAQSEIGSPPAPAVLTVQLPPAINAKPLPSRRVTHDETRDCTGKYLVGRRLTSRLALWTINFPMVTAQLVAGLYGLALGEAGAPSSGAAPHTSQITRAASDQLPATSFVVGAKDSDEPAELYSDMVLNALELRGEFRQKLSMQASFIGSANVTHVDGFTAPACGPTPVALYPQDCLWMAAGSDY